MIWKMEIERGAEVMREAIKTFNGLIVINLLNKNSHIIGIDVLSESAIGLRGG